jgi:hypothetical protein
MSKIPEKIVYISGKKTTISLSFDDYKTVILSEEVTPAFIASATSEKSIETGKEWVRNKNFDISIEPSLCFVENKEITSIRVVGLEHRSQGGRAWKVVLPNGFFVDFREDILLETIRTVGVKEGGFLNGSFVWASIGSQIKLIRVDSELYKQIIKENKISAISSVQCSELEPMTFYRERKGDVALYLGKVRCLSVENKVIRVEIPTWWGFGFSNYEHKTIPQKAKICVKHLWIESYKWSNEPLTTTDTFENLLTKISKEGCYLNFYSGKNDYAIEKLQKLESLPKNHVEQLRLVAEGLAKKYSNNDNYLKTPSESFTMVPATEKKVIIPEKLEHVLRIYSINYDNH